MGHAAGDAVCWGTTLVVVGPAGRPDHNQQHCYHHAPKVKLEAATAVDRLLMMDVRTPETCWAVHKRQVIKLEKLLHLVGWFIWTRPIFGEQYRTAISTLSILLHLSIPSPVLDPSISHSALSMFCPVERFHRSYSSLTYLLTPWSRVLLEKLTNKLCS